MNKSQLIEVVAKKADLKKKDAEAAVAATIGAIEDALVAGEKVQLIGFGSFEVKKRAARTGRNPATGDTIKIKASKYPAFTAGAPLKEKVNAGKKKK
ncbi:MAG: HU family DNA-binding protein [Clostridia bacterium]|nr:HU family DNA-binding protein [Clostridia bacterium]